MQRRHGSHNTGTDKLKKEMMPHNEPQYINNRVKQLDWSRLGSNVISYPLLISALNSNSASPLLVFVPSTIWAKQVRSSLITTRLCKHTPTLRLPNRHIFVHRDHREHPNTFIDKIIKGMVPFRTITHYDTLKKGIFTVFLFFSSSSGRPAFYP